ncbi:MAG: BCCT family transporter [Bacillaceae bacterium]|nr:BCCT family transporter [Bacillaceae bacterium]
MQQKVSQVFYISIIIAIIFITWGIIPEAVLPVWNLEHITGLIQGFLVNKFGWFYLMYATAFLVFALFLIFSKYGNIVLGKDGEEPEYSYLTWFAMLFSAGMGIGLVFWGAAEPIYHFHNPPVPGQDPNVAAKMAMRYSFFHWGLHPWGIYAVLALALAYFQFRKESPGLISRILTPLFGDKMKGGWGTVVDILAVFATVFGVATSLGFGAMQISGGFSFLFQELNDSFRLQLIIILVVTVLFLTSAMTGLNRGIKFLSTTNIILAILLMLFVLFTGPTNFIMDYFTTTLGSYLQNLPSMSFRMTPFNQDNTWVQDWTIFYWAWWIAWAPFVGMFIARVSRGRTVREFILGVLIVPTVFGALWFSVFGGSAISIEYPNNDIIMNAISSEGTEVALFTLLDYFPVSSITSTLAILLISTFFVTSADSATFVLGMQTTNGSLNPAKNIKFSWGIIQSAAAAVLLWQGGLSALQTASIIAAFPFTIVLILIVFSLMKCFKEEARRYPLTRRKPRPQTEE